MKNKKPSLKDISDVLKVSKTTISFVLNGKGKENGISDKVIQEVSEYLVKIKYKPNLLARSLRTGKTKILVFMVEDIANFFFAKLARIVEDLAYKRGYTVLFCSNENEDMRSRELINLFSELQVDGFIIIPSPGIKEDIKSLMENNIPVILFDRYFPEIYTNFVVIDNKNASENATLHLIGNQYKKIGFVTTDVDQIQMHNRLEGYETTMKNSGLETIVCKLPYDHLKNKKTIANLQDFMIHKNLDAVFFATNYLTQLGLEIFKNENRIMNKSLGIVSFDDSEFFAMYTPSITAISQPLRKIGEALMNNMLDNLLAENPKNTPLQLELKSTLIIRDSSLPRI